MSRIANKIIEVVIVTALFLSVKCVAEAAIPQCVNFKPTYLTFACPIDVTITGADTHFDQTSQVSFR